MDLRTGLARIKAGLAVFALVAAGSASADVILFEDADGGGFIAPGVNASCVVCSVPPVSSQGYGLGNFLRTDSTAETYIAIGSMGAHDTLTVSFDLAIIDSWDGSTPTGGVIPPDFFNVIMDGATVFSETFDNFVLSDGSASSILTPVISPTANLGFGGWNDSLYHLSLTIAHSASTLDLRMSASGSGFQGGLDESWAWDNLTVEINSVPEPGTLALLGLGLVGMGLARRRRVR